MQFGLKGLPPLSVVQILNIAMMPEIKRNVVGALGNRNDVLPEGMRNACLVKDIRVLTCEIANDNV